MVSKMLTYVYIGSVGPFENVYVIKISSMRQIFIVSFETLNARRWRMLAFSPYFDGDGSALFSRGHTSKARNSIHGAKVSTQQ